MVVTLHQGRWSRESAAGTVAPHFFSNVMLKQLRFKTLVVKFPREAYKMLYFYLKSRTRNSAPPSLHCTACRLLLDTGKLIGATKVALVRPVSPPMALLLSNGNVKAATDDMY